MSYPSFSAGCDCCCGKGPTGPAGPPGPPGPVAPGTLTARRLTEGVDYTYTQGFATEVVDYPEGEFNVGVWTASWGQPSVSDSTPAGTTLNRFSFWNWRQRELWPTDLGMAENLFFNSNQGQIPLTITGTENLYYEDGVTLRAVQVTASGEFDGAALELIMALSYDPENPGTFSYQDSVYAYVTLTENNMPPGSTLTLNNLQFTMPAATITYQREYAAVIELADPFEFPDTMQIRYQVTFNNSSLGVLNNTAIITTLEFPPDFFMEISKRVVTSRTPPILDFDDPTLMNELLWHEGKVLTRGNRIGFEFPIWNSDMRVTSVAFLDVIRRSVND